MKAHEPATPLEAAQTSELLADLDAILLELRRRLDAYVDSGREDVVAADEGFGVAGLVHGSTEAASRHAADVRDVLERAHSAAG